MEEKKYNIYGEEMPSYLYRENKGLTQDDYNQLALMSAVVGEKAGAIFFGAKMCEKLSKAFKNDFEWANIIDRLDKKFAVIDDEEENEN